MGASERELWMDRLRGLAVLLVIAWHVPAIPAVLGTEMPDWVRLLNNTLSPYRIPALLLLSGMLLRHSLAKPLGRYYWGKLANIGWPYLVWCVVLLLVTPGADWGSIWFWLGGSYLWYLVVIGVCYMVGPIIRWVHPLVIPAACVIVVVVADPTTNAYMRILEYSPYFFVGTALEPAMRRFFRWPGRVVLLCALASIAWGVYSGLMFVNTPRLHPIGFVMSVIGVCCLAWALQRARSIRWLEWCGRHSLELYVVHFPAMVVAWQLGASELPTPVAYAIMAIVGCGSSVLLARYMARTPLFRLPTAWPRAAALADAQSWVRGRL